MLVNPSTRWEEGGRGRGGNGGELASVSVLWWRWWWWCGGGVEVVEVVYTHKHSTAAWLGQSVLSQGPTVTTSQG